MLYSENIHIFVYIFKTNKMRRAFSNKSIMVENDIFYGISLGYDFCAEHEWGIKGIRRKFGLNDKTLGIDARKMTIGKVFYREDENLSVLTSEEPYKSIESIDGATGLLPYDIKSMWEEFETAWDGNDFCAATKNPEQFKYIRELKEAFDNNNIVIASIGKMLAFENLSLCLLIADKIPQEAKDEMYRADKKAEELIVYEELTGVTELKNKIKGRGYKGEKYFMACSPHWINYEDAEDREKKKNKLNTKYDIKFWINYSDDDDNFGWYTTEDIIKWLSTPGLKLSQISKKGSK